MRIAAAVLAAVLALGGAPDAAGGPLAPLVRRPVRQARLVANARRYLGVPYVWSGRSARGLDCVGLLFRAYADTYGVRVRDFDRHNRSNASIAALLGHVHRIVPASELAADADAITRELAEGDALFFLWPTENPVEPPFATVGAAPHWVWHVGLAAADGAVLHATPIAGAVVAEPLEDVMRSFDFTAVAIVKPGR